MLVLERVCARFPQAAARLADRPAGRPGYRIEAEADVRDLLHALLAVEHDDVRPEASGPGGADLVLGLEQIVVTVRLAGPGLDLAGQVASDLDRWRGRAGCRTLVCFVYDPHGQVPDPRGLEAALSRDHETPAVRVLIASPRPQRRATGLPGTGGPVS